MVVAGRPCLVAPVQDRDASKWSLSAFSRLYRRELADEYFSNHEE